MGKEPVHVNIDIHEIILILGQSTWLVGICQGIILDIYQEIEVAGIP